MLHTDLNRFKGKGLKSVMTKLSLVSIPENALLDGVVKLLDGREMFRDTDDSLDEKIYAGHVFEDILSEMSDEDATTIIDDKPLFSKTYRQLVELSELVSQDYVLITKV